ncbi:MAG: hypothetical protein HYV07_24180 [Deltaproteobacteria bacterium]|nr:hypothetical protein [Deltaproteobacteria bacterium]
MVPTLVLTALLALPPPLCRGRITTAYDPSLDIHPGQRALAEVQTALNVLCGLDPGGGDAAGQKCGRGIVVHENSTIGMNAVTWVSGVRDGPLTSGKIVYSKEFLNALDQSFGPGASFGVLAHEVGHYLTATLSLRRYVDSSWDEELRADYFAGCALGRSGRPPDEMENTLRALASFASPTHPAFDLRVPKVRRGYEDCRRVQDERDRATEGEVFGIGAYLRAESRSAGCWHYFFRSAEDVKRLGPIAAKRHRSRFFGKEEECRRAETEAKREKLAVTEPCLCRADEHTE